LPAVRQTSAYAEDGTAIHAFLERVAVDRSAHAEALAALPIELRARCEAIDVSFLFEGLESVRTEVAFAIDVRDGLTREIACPQARDYGELGEWEIAGTADFVAVRTGDGTPVVGDFKTGPNGADRPREHAQVRAQAYAWAQLCGETACDARIVLIDEGGACRVLRDEFDVFDQVATLDALQVTLARVRASESLVAVGGTPHVATGSHCQYCPAWTACPSHVALARRLVPTLTELDERLALMSPVDAGRAYDVAQRAQRLVSHVLDELKARARQEPLPLPDGKVLRPSKSYMTTRVDAAALERLARELGADDSAIAACVHRTEVSPVKAQKS
jgi:hypothetical protein